MSGAELDVVIIGAGLAGLAAATELQSHGIAATIIEAESRVGGRVKTDEVDGFLLDHGFQLFNPAYPEGRRVLDYAALGLQPLAAGIGLRAGDHLHRIMDPRKEPLSAVGALSAPLSIPSMARFAAYAYGCSRSSMEQLRSRPDASARDALMDAGIRDDVIDRLVAPFLRGIFLERELSTSRRFMDVVLRSMVRAVPSLPSGGMQAIPEQLAARLQSGTIHLGESVVSIRPGHVTTSTAEYSCRDVIVAASPQAVAHLCGTPAVPTVGVTTWYHRAEADAASGNGGIGGGRSLLHVDADGRGPLVNTIPLSHDAPTYAPAGSVLISSSALGTDDVEEVDVRRHLSRLYGCDTSRWELIAAYRIPHALPRQASPLDFRRPVTLAPGLHIAGDHRDTASIQGALVSGRRAAQAVMAQRQVQLLP